jgi:hypothetical protein
MTVSCMSEKRSLPTTSEPGLSRTHTTGIEQEVPPHSGLPAPALTLAPLQHGHLPQLDSSPVRRERCVLSL